MGRLTGKSAPVAQSDPGQEAGTAKHPKRRGHLFLVDVPTFAKVCDLGDVDAAASYLILAAGTGGDNRTSTWSREAINQRTALNWRKADAAMVKLEQAGLIRWLTAKGVRKPRIDLPPVETRKPMPKNVAALAERIMHGDQPHTTTDKAAATVGRDLGWFACDDAGMWSFIAERPMAKAYLPMELVGNAFGVASDESPIVDRIRKARDPKALQLLVELYALQDLAEHGGVNRYWLKAQFTRGETQAATGSIKVWTFTEGSLSARVKAGPLSHHWRKPTAQEEAEGLNGARDFYARISILEDAGALEWVYHLAEDETESATTIYPVGVCRHGKMVWTELESIIGGYAIRAAFAIGGYAASQVSEWEDRAPGSFILPADRMARKVALVGVPRLRHRARTTNAARWQKELIETATAQKDVFRGIIAEKAPAMLAEADRRFADFNVDFNDASTVVQRDINDTLQSAMHISPSDEGAPENRFLAGERF